MENFIVIRTLANIEVDYYQPESINENGPLDNVLNQYPFIVCFSKQFSLQSSTNVP